MAEGRFQGKVAVVTGSSSGIGQAIAVRLASEGAAIVIDFHSHPEGAEDTQKQIAAKESGKSITVQADVSKPAGGQTLIDAAWNQLGGCDILVNNAGIEKGADFWDVTEADYDAVLDLNLKGRLLHHPGLRPPPPRCKKNPAALSTSAPSTRIWSSPTFASYCAAKGGMRMLMRDLAVELGPAGHHRQRRSARRHHHAHQQENAPGQPRPA